jgi:hypothetical protein
MREIPHSLEIRTDGHSSIRFEWLGNGGLFINIITKSNEKEHHIQSSSVWLTALQFDRMLEFTTERLPTDEGVADYMMQLRAYVRELVKQSQDGSRDHDLEIRALKIADVPLPASRFVGHQIAALQKSRDESEKQIVELRYLAQELLDFITTEYPRESIKAGNWPGIKPLIDQADKILGIPNWNYEP